MQLCSVNVGQERPMPNVKASGKTGIYKLPVHIPVQVTANGLVNDAICDTKNHGGPDQAIYIYGMPDYAWWSGVLGRELAPGTFGENLTITELESTQLSIGDRLHVGSVILEVTAPRIPCATLAARMGDPTFVKRFRAAERPGLYCRVILTGWVQLDDQVTLERYQDETILAVELFRDYYEPALSEAKLRRHLAAPIAIRDRVEKEARLAELLASK
ncbi:MAG: MOSC domain-containing protein [Chloroflexi bacterium]|nr:MOSC domain-containing protein [Chloroflexota bacterium]